MPHIDPLNSVSTRDRINFSESEYLGHEFPNQVRLAAAAGIPATTYAPMRSARDPIIPTVLNLIRLARLHRRPLDFFLEASASLYNFVRDGIIWKLAGTTACLREQVIRVVGLEVILGTPVDEIQKRVNRMSFPHGAKPIVLDEENLFWRTRSALRLGLVQVLPHLSKLEDEKLADRLHDALEADRGDGTSVEVRVVRNTECTGLHVDPVAISLMARVAHDVVQKYLTRERNAYSIGLAGGEHVSRFVNHTGGASSPFPDLDGSDRRFSLVPLTQEPFSTHEVPAADALVGEFYRCASDLLGPRRVFAASLRPAGARRHGGIAHAVSTMQGHYRDLDIAVFGAGVPGESGWIARVLEDAGGTLDADAATDICLNSVNAEGKAIAMNVPTQDRGFLGASLQDIHRVAEDPRKLALLLVSGEAKGLPLVAVSRARCVRVIVCDQAAARAALVVLGGARRRAA